MLNLEKELELQQKDENYVSVKELAILEDELFNLRQKNGIAVKRSIFKRSIDFLFSLQKTNPVNRRKYINLALSLGWLTGAHRFYAKKNVLGILYLVLSWTGLAFTMTLIDLIVVLPMKADENGNILI